MAALFVVRNEGPDDLKITLRSREVIVRPGREFRCATSSTVRFEAVPALTIQDLVRESGGDPKMAEAMAKQMGLQVHKPRHAEED